MDINNINNSTSKYNITDDKETKKSVPNENVGSTSNVKSTDSLNLSDDAKKLAQISGKLQNGFYDKQSVLLETAIKIDKLI